MMIFLLLVSCAVIAVVLVVLVIGAVFIMQSGNRDVVSTARQGWISRRSEQDQDDW